MIHNFRAIYFQVLRRYLEENTSIEDVYTELWEFFDLTHRRTYYKWDFQGAYEDMTILEATLVPFMQSLGVEIGETILVLMEG